MGSLLTTLAVAALAAAQPAPVARHDLETLLARPVSPGTVALLLLYAGDERAAGRVIEALVHPDARVRAVAARLASVAPLDSAGPAIRRALDSETDRSAAAEQLRAAALLMPRGDDLSLVAAAHKHELADVLADTLGIVRGPAALPLLDPLREAGLTEHAESDFIASATREGREGLSVVAAAALRTGNARMWSTVLSLAREPSADLSPGMLVAALGSSKPEIRAVVYWYLALTHRKDGALRPELEAIIARTPETASPDSANVDAAFALVVLRRAQQGLKFGGDWGARAASGAPVIPVAPRYDPAAVARLLTKAEASALSRRLTDGRDDKVFEREAKKTDEKPGKIEGEEYGGVSFAGGLPPGTLRDILAVTGCQPAADVRAMGFVGYRSDGRPRKVSVSDLPVSRACAEAAGPALGLTLAPPGLVDAARPDRRTVVIIPMNEEALACADEPEPTAAERLPEEEEGAPPGKIQAPRKVKSVAPWYPERAKAARRQGIVILKAVITQSGCIRSVRVIRGVSPELDVSAMIAVGQWRYTPTLLRGKPVPVIMTVTVNFHLN